MKLVVQRQYNPACPPKDKVQTVSGLFEAASLQILTIQKNEPIRMHSDHGWSTDSAAAFMRLEHCRLHVTGPIAELVFGLFNHFATKTMEDIDAHDHRFFGREIQLVDLRGALRHHKVPRTGVRQAQHVSDFMADGLAR